MLPYSDDTHSLVEVENTKPSNYEHLWNPTLAAKGASRMGHPLLLWLEKKVQEREREPADRRIVSGEAHLSGPEGGRRLPTGAVLSP
jgi:hypothetical protein